MCGIYANFSSHAGEKVFEGLKRMEYRGYDSWGVAILTSINDGLLEVKKDIGKLSHLKNAHFTKSKLSLGHTRWATHGGVTQKNAHPHLASDGSFALVQNGVVENYQELKAGLLKDGYKFISETDTEVIVGLLEKEVERAEKKSDEKKSHEKNREDLLEKSFVKVFKKLAGRNTVALITTDGRIMAIRNGSPLVAGKHSNGNFCFSSDVLSMTPDVEKFLIIKSGQMATFNSKDSIFEVLDVETGKNIKVKFSPLEEKLDLTNASMNLDKDVYKNYMIKEIHEQARVLSNVIFGKKASFNEAVKMLKNAENVFTLGCGSASYATGNTAYLLRKVGISASSVPAYEADSYLESLENSTTLSSSSLEKTSPRSNNVCVVFSQSGETADTNEVVEIMISKGVKIISVVNMPGSSLTQMSDLSFMLNVGPEMAVASTKAFTGHVLWGVTIYDMLRGSKFIDLETKVAKFEHKLKIWFDDKKIQDNIKKIAKSLVNEANLFVLGRGDLYYASLESALKLKEISYIHAEGFSGGELKHGVIALITQNTPVLCLVNDDDNKANMMNAIAEVRARGGRTIVVAKENNELFSEWIPMPETDDYIFIASVIPSQLMTCYVAMERGYDVDKPRNLAKSVTVK